VPVLASCDVHRVHFDDCASLGLDVFERDFSCVLFFVDGFVDYDIVWDGVLVVVLYFLVDLFDDVFLCDSDFGYGFVLIAVLCS